ncbi:bacterioferritin [Paucibacter oligotrophus]|uniref:Bacterioferritin n=1 Tax=Roseateles oligotrophus TaxID=1769250 RepID=A0A840LAH2_9BURK|nr:bacterioferritin [Roseateles oligotrophus]MBB4843129.1 bacterioferritin [Roseateles oligotrophus]
MPSTSPVITALNHLLSHELAARDQYFIHSRMLAEWGFAKTAARIAHEMEDETAHADVLIKRILMLGGLPAMQASALNIGFDVPSMLASDLAVEQTVGQLLRETIALCEQTRDYVSRDLLLPLLVETEVDHAHWLEQQQRLITQLGLANYLQSQTA